MDELQFMLEVEAKKWCHTPGRYQETLNIISSTQVTLALIAAYAERKDWKSFCVAVQRQPLDKLCLSFRKRHGDLEDDCAAKRRLFNARLKDVLLKMIASFHPDLVQDESRLMAADHLSTLDAGLNDLRVVKKEAEDRKEC